MNARTRAWLKQRYVPHPKRVRTHCKHGHPLSGDNLKLYRGERLCVTCVRARGMSYYYRKKEKLKAHQS
jgi:hypothetical protein